MHLGISCPKHTSLTSRTNETSSVVFMWLGFLFLVHQTSTNLCRVCILHTWDQRPNAFWLENAIFRNVSWAWGTCGETLKLDINMHVWPVQNDESPRAVLLGAGSSGRVGMNVNNGTAARAGLVALLEGHYDLIDLLGEVSCIGIRKKSRKSFRSPSPWFFIQLYGAALHTEDFSLVLLFSQCRISQIIGLMPVKFVFGS